MTTLSTISSSTGTSIVVIRLSKQNKRSLLLALLPRRLLRSAEGQQNSQRGKPVEPFCNGTCKCRLATFQSPAASGSTGPWLSPPCQGYYLSALSYAFEVP